jgi:predicted transcriptional regulator
MSKALSLKLREDIFDQVEVITRQVNLPRNTYINRALAFYNALNTRKLLRKQLLKESQLVRADSMRVLHEFENCDESLP